ncbi:GNAT family N-acetyltransferase [Winogradskya consettensis]|uniref:Acetyltransferase n=1 Tax=Winogradskya consettensis TaxID=113560 RepID=A0A919VPF5_9ACTN|nr:GNAT family N-acetyltransferase [Actinoplanes consettensis]GIM70840.1 acetyltransferase [Actinoplanes consettensis]
MPELVEPTVRLHAAWLEAHREWGPGRHEDGFGLQDGDEVESGAGFAAWTARLAASPALFRWVVEDGRVQGGIALRQQPDGSAPPMGHLGYGIRPGARRRGLASWALGAMLGEARELGLERVLVLCADGNEASARTIESQGGVLDDVRKGARRYWILLGAKR